MSSLKTPLVAALACLIIYLVRLQWPGLPSLWLVLPVLSFGLSMRYGNGLTANLFTATIIAVFVMVVQMDIVDSLPVVLLSFGIAGTMDYFKAKLDEATEARVRVTVQLEQFEKSLADIRELPDVSRRQVNSLQLCLEDIENLINKNPEISDELIKSRARIADVISMVAGWRELAKEHELVKQKYSDDG